MNVFTQMWFWFLLLSGLLLTVLFFVSHHVNNSKEAFYASLKPGMQAPSPSDLAAQFSRRKRPFRSVYLLYILALAYRQCT